MNKFKKLATLCMAMLLGVGAAALVGCNSQNSTPESVDTNPTSSESVSNDAPSTDAAYVFTVLNADGTPAAGINVQLCQGADVCYQPVLTDANGVAVYDKAPAQGVYSIHLWDDLFITEYEFEGETNTPDAYAAITLTLKA